MRAVSGLIAVGFVLIAGPASAHQWVSYFERGRAELSPRGYTMAQEVANYCRTPWVCTDVFIDSHTDAAEARTDDADLDLRRAWAIQLELVRQRVSPALIRIRRHGAERPARLVEGDEPLNRRVTLDVAMRPEGASPLARLDHSSMPRIFFATGEIEPDPAARHALRMLAAMYAESCWITIEGRTDTQGSVAANQRLSEARAEATARILAMNGVPWDALRQSGSGETRLSVSSADGVAKPMNRVVALDLRCP